ncbi:MAG: ABC transporter permease [bacterium]
MRILNIIAKNLLQISRDWKSSLFLVAMPILFTVFFGVVTAQPAESRLTLAVLNADGGGSPAAELLKALGDSPALRLIPLAGDEGSGVEERIRQGEWNAALIVVPGWSEAAWSGQPIPLQLVAESANLQGQAAATAVQSAAKRILGAVEAARLAAEFLEARKPFADATARTAFLQEVMTRSLEQFATSPLSVETVPMTLSTQPPSGYAQASPGVMVQFAIFGLLTSATLLVMERKTRTMARLLTTPATRGEVLLGHGLTIFLVTFLQELLLVLLGQLVFGLSYFSAPGGTLLLMVSLALWTTSLGLLIGALVSAEEQVILWGLVAMFFFSALGGAWFPLEIAGPGFAAIGRWIPTSWAVEGFQNIIVRGLGDASALLPSAILLGVAALFFAIAVWRFRFD